MQRIRGMGRCYIMCKHLHQDPFGHAECHLVLADSAELRLPMPCLITKDASLCKRRLKTALAIQLAMCAEDSTLHVSTPSIYVCASTATMAQQCAVHAFQAVQTM